MDNNITRVVDLIQGKPKRIVVSDNDYFPFVDISELIEEIEVGEIISFPAKKDSIVRVMAARIGKELQRDYRCRRNTKEKTIDVCRFV